MVALLTSLCGVVPFSKLLPGVRLDCWENVAKSLSIDGGRSSAEIPSKHTKVLSRRVTRGCSSLSGDKIARFVDMSVDDSRPAFFSRLDRAFELEGGNRDRR